MTTERMLMVAATAMAWATCCAKEDYKDPQKFAEKYVRLEQLSGEIQSLID